MSWIFAVRSTSIPTFVTLPAVHSHCLSFARVLAICLFHMAAIATSLQRFLTCAADRCNTKFATDGYPFTFATSILSEDVAYGLMLRVTDSPYEFFDSEVTALANDNGQLAETWCRARLTRIVNPTAGTYSFLQPVLHDYLAAQAVIRHVRDKSLSIAAIGLQPRWFSVLLFAFDTTRCLRSPSPLCQWLVNVCRKPDHFGVVLTTAGHFLAAMHQGCSRLCMNNADVRGYLRAVLWNGFIRSPDPAAYARPLVDLDFIYTLNRMRQLRSISPDLRNRLLLLADILSDVRHGAGEKRRRSSDETLATIRHRLANCGQ